MPPGFMNAITASPVRRRDGSASWASAIRLPSGGLAARRPTSAARCRAVIVADHLVGDRGDAASGTWRSASLVCVGVLRHVLR